MDIKKTLREALWHPVEEETRSSQLAAIEAAVDAQRARPTPVARRRRRFTTVAVTAALLAVPAGVAFAAEGSLPGEALYPVKKLTEAIRSVVDADIAAEHRVAELETLLASDAPAGEVAIQADRAEAEVARLGADHPLADRLEALAVDRPDRPSDADPPPIRSDDPATTTTVVDPTTTTNDRPSTTVADDPVSTTSTTVPTTTTAPATTTTVLDRETVRVIGRVMAGPTCPTERHPPDPDCADRPVDGAVLIVTDLDGAEQSRVTSDADGRFGLRLESGAYRLVPQPHDGLLGTAPPQEFTVESDPVELQVAYDTGIR
ncbi:MAG: carboxypeptidase regulatory-like domain-containing protein [Acidimicrobiia bacterium]|nr:carboxypeptidase-like regulatory domain-containing protein [Acidimicrobiia bacterium]MBT8217977.1 carboxypeptidase-like regulatory domain-containing protein [Acidimicrobiia bacterium]NNF09303.1 carboxypeptidase regulatory-like domain-containing protein [Acidimicrobiia bacterium]NNL69821.1 carboxypeptidase regulatory-like domain-containing protein [Acidimicrobiia bacterium]